MKLHKSFESGQRSAKMFVQKFAKLSGHFLSNFLLDESPNSRQNSGVRH